MTIEEALRKHEDRLMSLPNVQGVGIGRKDGRDTIKVLVSAKVAGQGIPASLEGYEVEVEVIGTITAQDAGSD